MVRYSISKRYTGLRLSNIIDCHGNRKADGKTFGHELAIVVLDNFLIFWLVIVEGFHDGPYFMVFE